MDIAWIRFQTSKATQNNLRIKVGGDPAFKLVISMSHCFIKQKLREEGHEEYHA